jgi:hypothetical protein
VLELSEASQNISTRAAHLTAHQKDGSETTKYNNQADALTQGRKRIKHHLKLIRDTDNNHRHPPHPVTQEGRR